MVNSIGGCLNCVLFQIIFLTICFIDIYIYLSLTDSAHLICAVTEPYEARQSSYLLFPLLEDNYFWLWRQRMSDKLKELDIWWIVSGREVSPDKDSTDVVVQATYRLVMTPELEQLSENSSA